VTSEAHSRADPRAFSPGSRAASVHPEDYLLCGVGACGICALPLRDVVETMRLLTIEPLGGLRGDAEHEPTGQPRLPPFVLGMAIIRGLVTPVLDAALLVGAKEPCQSTRLVALKLGQRPCALAVESVLGVRSFSQDQNGALPRLLAELGAEAIRTLRTLDQQLLWILESARVVPEVVWRAIDARGNQ
jgi:purine-binding chemotaxis protein CheW